MQEIIKKIEEKISRFGSKKSYALAIYQNPTNIMRQIKKKIALLNSWFRPLGLQLDVVELMNNFKDPLTFDLMLEKMKKKEHFKFIRYGDGEMRCILQPGSGANCDGHEYFPELGKELAEILIYQNQNQTMYIGLQNFGDKQYPDFKDGYPSIVWSNADILHHASIKGRLPELFSLLNSENTLLVGPKHLAKMNLPLIIVPDKNCYKAIDSTYGKIEKHINASPNLQYIFFSCSMMTEVLIRELRTEITLIDAGSVFDPYCGVISRTYHKKLNI